MAEPFISAEDLAAYRKQEVDEALATIATDSASQIVREEAGGPYYDWAPQEDHEILLDGNGTDTLLLPQLPVLEVSEVVQTYSGSASPYTMVPDVDYVVDLELGCIRTKSGYGCNTVFQPGRQNYAVTYSHGYETVPSSVRLVALQLAARIYDQQLVKQESVGGYQAVYVAADFGLTPHERDIVAKHAAGRRR